MQLALADAGSGTKVEAGMRTLVLHFILLVFYIMMFTINLCVHSRRSPGGSIGRFFFDRNKFGGKAVGEEYGDQEYDDAQFA